MSIRQGWVGFKHFFFSMNNVNKIQKKRLNLVLLLLPCYGSFTRKTTSKQKIIFGKDKLREQKF